MGYPPESKATNIARSTCHPLPPQECRDPARRRMMRKTQSAESAQADTLIGQYEPEVQTLIHAARRTLRQAFRGATETCDLQARVLGYGYGPGYKGIVATLILGKTGIKIGIPYGSSLPDPAHLLAGGGRVHRHVAIKDAAGLKAPELAALLRNAFRAWQERTGDGRASTSAH